MNEGQKIRHLEALRSSPELKSNLKGHGLNIKKVCESNQISPAKLKGYWEKKQQHNSVADVMISGFISVALSDQQ